jgi:flagellar biosynthesis protein FliP
MRSLSRTGIAVFVLLVPQGVAAAQKASDPGMFGIRLGGAGSDGVGAPLEIVALLTFLSLLPAIIMTITPFLRIVTVLHFLRQALGAQTTPSNQVLVGLSLFLAALVMQPVANEIYVKSWEPLEKGQITQQQAIEEAAGPLRTFLLRFAREKDVQLMLEATHNAAPKSPQDLDLRILIPAYVLSELKVAFQIGAVLFLPFVIIDLIIASITLSLGMVQLPPVMISAPLKILLFVLVDGWNLVIGSLLKSFY